jgi:hypothetical protein
MLFLLYSETNASTLKTKLGAAEYSYFFVLEYFRLMLEQHNQQYTLIADPEREADLHYDAAVRSGKRCVLLSFAPPHRTFVGLRCPTIPIFAWEFDTLPDEVWNGDPRNDWRSVLAELGHAITHSQYSADAIERAMGEGYPVLAIPAPVFDRFQREMGESPVEMIVPGPVLDSHERSEIEAPIPVLTVELHAPAVSPARKSTRQRLRSTITHFAEWYRDVVRDLLPAPLQRLISGFARALFRCLKVIWGRQQRQPAPAGGRDTVVFENAAAASEPVGERKLVSLPAEAIVYTSVFNPNDGRKNWGDILTAFCRALSEREDAVLILKFTSADPTAAIDVVRDTLRRLPPFRCRVLALGGHLDEGQYRRLIAASTYVVNSSLSEGQCLPLMEFLSNGKPAIAPRNTAMIDYFDAEIGFLVNCSKELCCWPHDDRKVFRTHRYRTDWQSLAEAFSASYELKRRNPTRYDEMARATAARMRNYCSEPVVWEKFARFVELQLRPQKTRSSSPLAEQTPRTAQFTAPAFANPG